MRYVFAIFLFAHGMIHALWFAPAPEAAGKNPRPFTLATSPVLSPLGIAEPVLRPLGTALIVVPILAFTLSSLGAAGLPGLVSIWAGVTLFASTTSIVVTMIFWNPQLPIGLLIDAALIATILGNWWPTTLVK